MPNYIDRRLNPKDKSLGNRQRFLRRARDELKRTINEQIKSGKIADAGSGQSVPVPIKGTAEPSFHLDRATGRREHVLPGNKEFHAGDKLPKPPSGGGQGSGKDPASGGDAEDDFRFVLSREEVLDLFFEDLELPHLIKLNLKEVKTFKPRRAGFAITGAPTNINVGQTMRNSYGRRIALRRPKRGEIEEKEAEIAALEAKEPADAATRKRLAGLREELEVLKRRRKVIPYIDPIDIRFNRFEPQPLPNANAVMFCLMDVSGSMGEREKDLAKRFFVLLHMFLSRRYERTDIVFIRHTHEAQEVDEETFFYSTRSGGTVVSTALEEMLRDHRGALSEQRVEHLRRAGLGRRQLPRRFGGVASRCSTQQIMPLCQYYAYVEIIDERESDIFRSTENGTALWTAYKLVSERWDNFR